MKKRTINLWICWIIFVFLIGWTCMNYYMTYDLRVAEFETDVKSTNNSITTNLTTNFDLYYIEDPQTVVSSLTWLSTYGSVPSRLYILDSDCNIVAKSGSFIQIIDQVPYVETVTEDSTDETPIAYDDISYVSLDAVMNDSIRQDIADLKDSIGLDNYNTILHMDYTTQNGQIFPVSLTPDSMWQKGGTSEPVLQLSDLPAEDSMENSDNCSLLLYLDPSDYKYDSIDGSTADVRKLYDSWEKLFEEDEDVRGAVASVFAWDYDEDNFLYSSSISNSRAASFYHIVLNGTPYCLVVMLGQDIAMRTLTSSTFRFNLIYELLTSLVILISALLIANIYYNRLQKLESSRKAFTNAAAHELKTPLAIIQNQGECILDGIEPDRINEYAHSICEEAARMNKLVVSFLQYNRLTSVSSIERKDLDLSRLLSEELDKYLPLMKDMGQEVTCHITEGIHASCNHELMALAMDNLLSNAMKYASSGDPSAAPQISVVLQPSRHGFCLKITNTYSTADFPEGKGIWEALSRGDASRTRSGNSTGMGLAITAEILKLHKFRYGCSTDRDQVTFYAETR